MKIHLIFHVSILEPFHESTILGKHIQPFPLLKIDGEEEFEVKESWIHEFLVDVWNT
jgi:hypothetical protein